MIPVIQERADGCQPALPPVEVVGDRRDAHRARELVGEVFRIRFHARIREPLGPALVKAQLPVDPSPCLGELAARGPFAGKPQLLVLAARVPGVGNKRQGLVKLVVEQVDVGPTLIAAHMVDPVGVRHGESLADVYDPQRVAYGQACLREDLRDEAPVLGDRPALHPFQKHIAVEVRREGQGQRFAQALIGLDDVGVKIAVPAHARREVQ